jgi:hypothetical protein
MTAQMMIQDISCCPMSSEDTNTRNIQQCSYLFPGGVLCSASEAREHCVLIQTCALPGSGENVTGWIPHTRNYQHTCNYNFMHSVLVSASDDELIQSSGLQSFHLLIARLANCGSIPRIATPKCCTADSPGLQ